MTLSFFDQFLSPTILGIPLIFLSLILPWLLYPTAPNRWLTSRLLTLQNWLILRTAAQLMAPINQQGQKWAVILTSLMLFLISINLLGLLPYTFTPTTQLSMNMGWGVPMWLATVLIGLRNQPTTSIGHLLPEGTPNLLIPALVVIETISLFIRPLALGVRLTANLTGGHLLMQLIATAAFFGASVMPTIALLPYTILFLLTILELAGAMIQAYVCALLLTLYLQENI
uniref:ATP synthase subunit a n=1 Tax=Protopterus annectens TaxID=7888 RepID=Q35417_PROAN|nr:ATP synthase F0 subunit 6 [Protopterus dolloi]AAC38026.1 Adenosine Triphosphatase subunit 6 [Protopterus annectens]